MTKTSFGPIRISEGSNIIIRIFSSVCPQSQYKENTMRLSRIHYDRLMSPLDEAVFWIEFTMKVQAHELMWYQYHSLDVLSFLLTAVLFIVLLPTKTCKLFIQKEKLKAWISMRDRWTDRI